MPRYSREHKARSRAAIVDAAAAAFRRRGYEGVGIDEICAAAGLTRGGFYGHFDSKADLYREVLAGRHDLVRRLSERRGRSPDGLIRGAARIARDYLKPAHAEGVLGGCSLAALAMDTIRSRPEAQRAYGEAVEQVAAEFARGRPDAADDDERALTDDERALTAIALCVGGLLVANACGEHPVGRRVAKAASRTVTRILEGEPA